MIYETLGNRPLQFRGADATAIVRQMHRRAWLTPPRKGDYMAAVAERCEQLGSAGVNIASCEEFLASLERLSFIRRVEDI